MRTPRIIPKKGRAIIAWFVATQVIYLIMVLVTLPRLGLLAGGLQPFDLMPRGYGFAHARDFLSAIGSEGRRFYLTRQIPLDLVYPAMFMISYCSIWLWLQEKTGSKSRLAGFFVALPVIAAVTDYLENTLIVAMLVKFPALSEAMVAFASLATITKSVATAGYFAALSLFLVLALYRRLKEK